MKKRVIAIVLFLFCGLILSGSVFSNKEESLNDNVRTIVLEDNKKDLTYYESIYDLYNEDCACFEMTEIYQSNTDTLGRNSSNNGLEVQFYVYVNKEEQYFIFSFEGTIGEEVVVSNKVRIDLVEYENKYYLVSSNGCITPYEEIYETKAIGSCAYAFADLTYGMGLGDLGGLRDLGGGGGGAIAAGAMLGVAAGVALASSRNNTSGTINKALSSTSSGSAAGSLPPNGNKNNNNKKKSIKEIIDDIKDEYKQNGKCDKFADELETGMKENNISGTKLELRTNYGRDFIYSDKANECISTNGKHVGIQIDNMVYDNMNPNGIPYNEWINDLGGENFFNIFKTLI